MAIKKADLEKKVQLLNERQGLGRNPEYITVGAYDLDFVYNGVKLIQYTNKDGGQTTISPNGNTTKRELFLFLQGMTIDQTT